MYHAHVYFALNSLEKAEILRQRIIVDRNDALEVFPLVPKLVGPHKMPMFEIHFQNNDGNLIEWLDINREGMSVLIHPVTGGEERLDHTERAKWLGRELGVFDEIFSS